MDDTLKTLKCLTGELEFSSKIRNRLTGVRLIDETDMETFERVLKMAHMVICPKCRGYGHRITGSTCTPCNGTGHRTVQEPDPEP